MRHTLFDLSASKPIPPPGPHLVMKCIKTTFYGVVNVHADAVMVSSATCKYSYFKVKPGWDVWYISSEILLHSNESNFKTTLNTCWTLDPESLFVDGNNKNQFLG